MFGGHSARVEHAMPEMEVIPLTLLDELGANQKLRTRYDLETCIARTQCAAGYQRRDQSSSVAIVTIGSGQSSGWG
jgi:hypothetical protein